MVTGYPYAMTVNVIAGSTGLYVQCVAVTAVMSANGLTIGERNAG